MSSLSKKEARHIVAKYLNSFASLLCDPNEDFYNEISQFYVQDKSRLEDSEEIGGMSEKYFYPTDEEKKIMVKEAEYLWRAISKHYI